MTGLVLGKAFERNIVSVKVGKHCMVDIGNIVLNTARKKTQHKQDSEQQNTTIFDKRNEKF